MTYSIVARDPETGRFGIAVQSHFLGVGPVVPWLEAGVGAVATQASVNTAFGPMGLELLRAGANAEQTVAALLASDENPQVRQVGVVDAEGRAEAAPFIERMLRAMEAAEREGGDVRGRQSAAIMVVDAELHARTWRGHGLVMDMRIEDHPDPVPELRRIVTLQLAYDMLDD